MQQDVEKYCSISGQQDGIKTTSAWTIAEPKNTDKKNATTAEQQATAEIKAKYKKQLKSGYYENIADIDTPPYFEVMLAKSYGDYKDKINWAEGVAVQIKYNGERVVARSSGMWSRTGERFVSIPHIEEALKPFFQKFPDAVLDGEGFNYDYRERLNEIHSIMSKKKPTEAELITSKELIRYCVYDGYGIPNKHGITQESDGYLVRKSAIDNAFFASCFADRYKNIIDKVPTWVIYSEKELEDLNEIILADKHEGIIIRILNKGYQHKRSNLLLKYKPINDSEFKIISVNEGLGKFANRVATVTCERIDGGFYEDGTNFFDATWKGTDDDAINAWNFRNSLMGKIVTIYYNGTTGKSKPNYPRFDFNNYNKGH
jgi:ATP-dependent DNA ligase